jgi:hypothetical protein
MRADGTENMKAARCWRGLCRCMIVMILLALCVWAGTACGQGGDGSGSGSNLGGGGSSGNLEGGIGKDVTVGDALVNVNSLQAAFQPTCA